MQSKTRMYYIKYKSLPNAQGRTDSFLRFVRSCSSGKGEKNPREKEEGGEDYRQQYTNGYMSSYVISILPTTHGYGLVPLRDTLG